MINSSNTNNNNHCKFIWSPDSWKLFEASQIPIYENQQQYHDILKDIKQLCPLIPSDEIQSFNQELKKVSAGQRFIIQIGDCSEVFDECTEQNWVDKFTFFQNVAKLFYTKTRVLPLIIGRICGQFSKPRSQQFEQNDTLTYRGDLINSIEQNKRQPDPIRLLKGAMLQQAGIEVLRRFNNKIGQKSHESKGVQSNSPSKNYQELNQIFISHECLHLPYESAFCKLGNETYFQSNAHFLWAGERTKKSTEAHVHYLSGIDNAIGFKIGASIEEEEFLQLNKILNPFKIQGRLFGIIRLGAGNVRKVLPRIIGWKKKYGLCISWICDPMHGNTYSLNGYKNQTRYLSDILEELEGFIEILSEMQEHIGGVHLEATPYDVTECLLNRDSLADFNNYKTTCDPRINNSQCLLLLDQLGDLICRYKQIHDKK